MRQSSVIFGALFVAFIVFITVRGELPAYLGALFPKKSGSSGGGLFGGLGSFGGIGSILGGSGGSSIVDGLSGAMAGG